LELFDYSSGEGSTKGKGSTHQGTIFHDVQALLDMSQRSHNSHILMLHLSVCDKRSTIYL